ncbi:hypothetical protein D8666_03370 [Ochrobactrum soli]|nr:hypothetical protein D8666_03370 [[Ochrobactrum] soli]
MGLSHRRSSFYSLAACSRLAAFIVRRLSAVLQAHDTSNRIDLKKGSCANSQIRAAFTRRTDAWRSNGLKPVF